MSHEGEVSRFLFNTAEALSSDFTKTIGGKWQRQTSRKTRSFLCKLMSCASLLAETLYHLEDPLFVHSKR